MYEDRNTYGREDSDIPPEIENAVIILSRYEDTIGTKPPITRPRVKLSNRDLESLLDNHIPL